MILKVYIDVSSSKVKLVLIVRYPWRFLINQILLFNRYLKHDGQVGSQLDVLLTCQDCVSLYGKILDLLRISLESQETRGFLKSVSFENLMYLYYYDQCMFEGKF